MNIEIKIDETAGFCWGVVKTIEAVEKTLENNNGKEVYIIGQIIHNPAEIERLERKGLKTISHEDLSKLDPENSIVIVRAHGEPPETYKTAEGLGLNLIDATCPLVKNLQKSVSGYYNARKQILIFGEKEHAEVVGIRGVCNDECTVIKTAEEALKRIDTLQETVLVSQTTMDRKTFREIATAIEEKYAKANETAETDKEPLFKAKDTICKFVSGREEKLANFVKSNDVVLFVAGRKSSNGKSLFNFCSSLNQNTYFIESPAEIDISWFKDAHHVGITGATSTPQWYLSLIKEQLEEKISRI